MAQQIVKLTFVGTEDVQLATWTNLGANFAIQVAAVPSDGFGPIRPWITARSQTTAVVNVSARWQGVVYLTLIASSGAAASTLTTLASSHYQIPTSFGSYASVQTYVIQPWIAADVTMIRVRMRNMDYDSGINRGDVTGVSIGIGTSNGSFNYVGTPTVYSAITVPGGSDYVSAWTPVSRGADGRLVIAYTVPASTNVAQTTGYNYQAMSVSGTASVNPIPVGTPGITNTLPYYLALELYTSKRRVVVIGDSIVAGYTNYFDRPGLGENYGYGLGIDRGYSVDSFGINGTQLASYVDTVGRPWMMYSQNILDTYVVVEAGVNDLPTQTLAQYKVNIAAMITLLQAAGARKIIWQTIMPQTAYPFDSLRQQVNAYIQAGVSGIDVVFDAATLMWDPANHSHINPTYDSGDGIHPNATGQGVIEAALYTIISAL